MSSPSNRRAAPHPAVRRTALAGVLWGAPEARRRGNTVTRSVGAVAAAQTSPRFAWGLEPLPCQECGFETLEPFLMFRNGSDLFLEDNL